MSRPNKIEMDDYLATNPLSDAQVAEFIECLKRETEIHPILLSDVSAPIDPINAQEEGKESARVISGFILRFLITNNLRVEGQSFAEIGMGQLRRASTTWALENLTDQKTRGRRKPLTFAWWLRWVKRFR